jgi:hypothetical protein
VVFELCQVKRDVLKRKLRVLISKLHGSIHYRLVDLAGCHSLGLALLLCFRSKSTPAELQQHVVNIEIRGGGGGACVVP